MRKMLLLVTVVIFFNSIAFAQSSKKSVNKIYQQIAKLDTLEVKQGQHLQLAKTFLIDKFIEYYVENGKEINTKKYGMLTIVELYNDSTFTYLGRKNHYGLIDFLKVRNADLLEIDYTELNGNALRRKFIDELVPETDKQKVKEKERLCAAGNYYADFNYKYNHEVKELEISYKWKVSCEFVSKIINKVYSAKYSLITKEFIK